jgi:hypothetical protein
MAELVEGDGRGHRGVQRVRADRDPRHEIGLAEERVWQPLALSANEDGEIWNFGSLRR